MKTAFLCWIVALGLMVPSPCLAQVAQVDRVSGIVDTLEIAAGQRMALRRRQGLLSPRSSDLASYRSGNLFHNSLFPGQPTTFDRIFPDRTDPEAFYLVARYRSDGPENRFIYRIKLKGKKTEWGAITQAFDDASYHQTKKGEIFIYSRDGILVRFFDGKLDHFQIPLTQSLKEKKGKLREIKCVESSDGTVAFYSIVDPEFEQKHSLIWSFTTTNGRRFRWRVGEQGRPFLLSREYCG